MAHLIAPNGVKVTAADDKVAELVRRGFTEPGDEKKAPAKKAASTSSKKS